MKCNKGVGIILYAYVLILLTYLYTLSPPRSRVTGPKVTQAQVSVGPKSDYIDLTLQASAIVGV